VPPPPYKPYKLIAVDVDGTLLTSKGIITDRTRSALGRALEGGASLAVATGRRRRSAAPIVAPLELPHFLVCSQGAVVWEGASIVYHSHLPASSARRALEVIREHGLVAVVFANAFDEEVIWVDGDWQSNPGAERYVTRASRGQDSPVRALTPEALEHDPIQFILFDSIEKLEQVNEALTGHALPPAPPTGEPVVEDGPSGRTPLWRLIFSRNQFTTGGAIGIVGPDTSKATALAYLCQRLGITREQVIAFGDNVNDLEMLEFAGLGVAMSNGTPGAKAAAQKIAPSNDEDGIAAVLEEVGLT
jgi:HAD superfamily hydrolase (TIGR01484 family)